MNSREKGKRGEREFASLCRDNGYKARRGQQYSGIEGEDVVGLPGVHVEVKRVERLNIETAMSQSKGDAKEGEKAIVAHRKNNCEWLITMRAEDWFEIYREWEAGNSLKKEKKMPFIYKCKYWNSNKHTCKITTMTCICGLEDFECERFKDYENVMKEG